MAVWLATIQRGGKNWAGETPSRWPWRAGNTLAGKEVGRKPEGGKNPWEVSRGSSGEKEGTALGIGHLNGKPESKQGKDWVPFPPGERLINPVAGDTFGAGTFLSKGFKGPPDSPRLRFHKGTGLEHLKAQQPGCVPLGREGISKPPSARGIRAFPEPRAGFNRVGALPRKVFRTSYAKGAKHFAALNTRGALGTETRHRGRSKNHPKEGALETLWPGALWGKEAHFIRASGKEIPGERETLQEPAGLPGRGPRNNQAHGGGHRSQITRGQEDTHRGWSPQDGPTPGASKTKNQSPRGRHREDTRRGHSPAHTQSPGEAPPKGFQSKGKGADRGSHRIP